MHVPPDLPVCVRKQPILTSSLRKPVLLWTAEEIEATFARTQRAASRSAETISKTSADASGAICTARDLYMQSKHRKVEHGRSTSVFVIIPSAHPNAARVSASASFRKPRGACTQTPTLPSNVVFLAKAAAVAGWSSLWDSRQSIGPMSATISTTMQSSQLTS